MFRAKHDKKQENESQLQSRGENIAFATESVVTCLATDPFTDPWINQWAQNWYARHHGGGPRGKIHQNLVGEYIGDFLSGFALVGCTEFFPHQMRSMGHAAGKLLDPVYRRIARKTTDINPGDPQQRDAYKEWRRYQEDNLIRTTVLSAAATLLNIAAQKAPPKTSWLYNPSPTSVILGGKLLGAGVTSALVLGSRLAFPKATKKADEWLSREVIVPVLKKVDRSSWSEKIKSEDKDALAHSR